MPSGDEAQFTAKDRAAQLHSTARPEQIAGLDSASISEATRAETRSTLMVYVKEWQHQFTGTADECLDRFKEKFAGRVLEEDWRVVQPFPGSRYYWLELNLWNLMGEWKSDELAGEHVDLIRADGRILSKDEAKIVGRATRAEVELKDYGVKKLVGRARDLRKTEAAPAQAE